jgi:prepilin-type N-terminal cleavage/methylation domain-containing protein
MRNTKGFTLIEALMAAVILAVAVGGIVAPIAASYQQTRNVKQTSIALSMAQQLLDEIVARPFTDPTDSSVVLGPDAGETTRPTFDNIDDYHGYQDTTDSSSSKSMKTLSGETIAWDSSEIYRRDVTLEYRATPAGPPAAFGDFLVITVKVTVKRLVARYPRGT